MATVTNQYPFAAPVYDIPELDAGSDFLLGIQVLDGNGNPKDIRNSNVTLTAQIREDWNLPIVANFACIKDATTISANQGNFTLSLGGNFSQSLVPTQQESPFKYDVLYVSPTSRQRLLQGNVSISGAITHV